MVKIWQLIGGPLAAGAPSYGTTGTVNNPALFGWQYFLQQQRHNVINGVATRWNGVGMSTTLFPELIPEIDANSTTFLGASAGEERG